MGNSKNIYRIYFLSAAILFIYLFLRAIMVPPVHDEAATFMHYIQRNEWKPFYSHWDANNHILNSFLSARIFKVFGYGTLYLRLASLLFFPLFVWFVYKLSKFIVSDIVKIGFLCGMLGAHNLMEYFGYARGYAMSMALLMGAVYYLLYYLRYKNIHHLWWFYLFSLLALTANLTLFNTVLIMNGIVFLGFISSGKHWVVKLVMLVLGFLPLVGASILSFRMKELGLLYYGGDKSFYHITMWSLIILLFERWHELIAYAFLLLAALGIIFLGASRQNQKIFEWLLSAKYVFAILFLGNILATVLLQKIMHVNYPEDRTAMYFYFFLVLFFCFTLDAVPLRKWKYLAMVWIIFPIHFFFNINFTHASYWFYEHIPNSFYSEIKKRAGDHPEQVSVGGYVLMDMIWAYYNQGNEGRLNDLQTADYPSFYYDYLILYDDNNNAYAWDYYNVLIESPISNIRLLERKEKVKLNPIVNYPLEDKKEYWGEYLNFYEHDSLKKYENLCFDIEFDFQTGANFFFGSVALGVEAEGKSVYLEQQELHLMRTNWKKGYHFHHRLYVHKIPQNASRIVCYFWNPRKHMVNLRNVKVGIYYWEY